MKKISEPIVFFGSGPVAAESLRLLAQIFTIQAVITKPRPAHHHGPVPVLELAETLQLQAHTVTNKKDLNALIATDPFPQIRLAVLIDFGIIVSQKIIDYFPLGIINSHFSILPEWRGADPITFAILSGQKTTGVSLMMLVEAMDEGPLVAYGEQPMNAFTTPVTTPMLTDKLIQLSHTLLLNSLPRVLSGESKGGTSQDITGREVSYSRKLTKKDGSLDWHKPAVMLEREIRAFIEWPKSRAQFSNIDAIITKSHVIDVTGTAGTIAIINKQPVVYCGEQALAIDMLKPAGKKEMTGGAFLAGYKSALNLST
jgi:methionyl-tRNA formyltransferase